ncbi:MAG TPA: mechanosensitive ion channel domain-containing protein [Vicinamibacterales bacterium]|nr:mechanosensitive ion channel domain-containing protein [Vicinamibacterales bacterium]
MAPLAVIAFLSGAGAHGQEIAVTEPATLVVWNRTIAVFRAPVGGVTPVNRAANSAARIDDLPDSAADAKIAIQPARVGTDEGLAIAVGDRVVFGLVPGDLDPEAQVPLDKAASDAARRLEELLDARVAQRDVRGTLRGAAYSALALIAFVVALRLILKFRNALVGKLTFLLRNKKLSLGGIDIIPTLETVERATFRVLSWALILGLAYLSLTFVFHQFPYTAPLGERLGSWLVAKLAAAGRAIALSLPSLIGVVAVLMITRAISLWASRVLVEVEHGLREVAWLAQEQAKATRRIASGIIWVLGIATAYPLLPWSDSKAFQGMSVVLGLAVSFASGGLINHWVSGLMVLYARSYRVGEFVSIGGTEGTVTEMGALATKLRTMRREEVTVPNAVMASERLINYTRLAGTHGMLLSTSIAIGYGVPWQRVQQLLTDAAAATPGVAPEHPPRVLAWELSDFFVNYQLHTHLAAGADRIAVRAELNTRILDVFAAAGVQIMTPHFESQPEQPVIARLARVPA